MRYVTVQMIAAHAGKHVQSVRAALKKAKVEAKREPGCLGLRILERDANRFLARQWPNVPPLGAALSAPLSQV